MNKLLQKKSVVRVKNFVNNYLPNIKLIELSDTARSAKDAAKSLNKEIGAIVKSIIFKNIANNEYYLCLISGDKFVSTDKLSTLTGNKILKLNADECKQITGFSIGGVSPVAHIQSPTQIFIDSNLNRYNKIYAAAGHPHVVFGITFDELCLITKGKISNIVV